MDEIEQTLQEIGLTENEARIYLALLRKGESTISQILSALGVHVGRIYNILDSLEQKGLVSRLQKNGVKVYQAAQPTRILDLLNKKKTVLDNQEKLIHSLIPQLSGLHASSIMTPNIQVFTGFEGMCTAYKQEVELYASAKEVLVFGVQSRNAYEKRVLDFFIYTIYAARKRAGIKVRKINTISAKNNPSPNEENVQFRYLDYPASISVNVIENLVLLGLQYETNITIVIQDETIATGFRKQFEYLWKQARAK